MTAPNHAITGAFIGLSIANPLVALPLAFASHFILDAIPHYDPPKTNEAQLLNSKRFLYEFLVFGGLVCVAIVVMLAISHPKHWLQACMSAFLATSPDLFWLPRYMYARRTKKTKLVRHPFLRFHSFVQWKTGPKLIWLELTWFVCCFYLLMIRL